MSPKQENLKGNAYLVDIENSGLRTINEILLVLLKDGNEPHNEKDVIIKTYLSLKSISADDCLEDLIADFDAWTNKKPNYFGLLD